MGGWKDGKKEGQKKRRTKGNKKGREEGRKESQHLRNVFCLSSGLIMLQTTNNVFNTSLYDQVIPQTLLAWQRVRLAHLMAHSGKEWADIVKQYNSGAVLENLHSKLFRIINKGYSEEFLNIFEDFPNTTHNSSMP